MGNERTCAFKIFTHSNLLSFVVRICIILVIIPKKIKQNREGCFDSFTGPGQEGGLGFPLLSALLGCDHQLLPLGTVALASPFHGGSYSLASADD